MTFNRKQVKKHHKPGTAPGTLVAPEGAESPVIRLMAWNEDDLIEQDIGAPEEITSFLKKWPVVWINVDGLGSTDIVERLGKIFKIHPLALEDLFNLHHRPKTEDFEDHLFIISRMASLKKDMLDIEQLSLFVGERFVLSFQERAGDCLDPVRERIRYGKGRRIRFSRADYLAYAIVDAVIDGYFPVLEAYGEKLNLLEDSVVENPHKELIANIHDIKRDLRYLRHGMWPMREMVSAFAANDEIVHEDTRPFLRDCHDHIIQVLDMLETYRERASGLIDIYLSSLGNRTNEIMRVLTIIATIFIPLSFIAGLYGMNFDPSTSPFNMPELRWPYGYPFALAVMAAIAGGLLLWFRRKGWLGAPRQNP